jgi:hypothetical protein
MRQDHPAGDKVFVDYSGKKIMIVDRETGVVRDAEIFVAVLGASNYTYAEATWTQTLPDWIEAHVRMFRFFGGVPRLVVPDNLKSGVHRASFYDPEINRSYGMMASHYGVGILPTRPRKPRDKAKVEAGVRFAQTYILGRLRRQPFFSLAEANVAIAAALERINAHIMRRLGVSRRQLFETVEMPVLASLPDADYQFAEWRVARVSLDYHVEIDGFFYHPHRRAIPSGGACCSSPAPLRRPPARHRSRPHAQRASTLRRVDSRAVPALGAIDRAQHRGARPRHPGQSASSRTGIPDLSGRASAVQGSRSGTRRADRGPSGCDPRADLQKHRLDYRQQPRPQRSRHR